MAGGDRGRRRRPRPAGRVAEWRAGKVSSSWWRAAGSRSCSADPALLGAVGDATPGFAFPGGGSAGSRPPHAGGARLDRRRAAAGGGGPLTPEGRGAYGGRGEPEPRELVLPPCGSSRSGGTGRPWSASAARIVPACATASAGCGPRAIAAERGPRARGLLAQRLAAGEREGRARRPRTRRQRRVLARASSATVLPSQAPRRDSARSSSTTALEPGSRRHDRGGLARAQQRRRPERARAPRRRARARAPRRRRARRGRAAGRGGRGSGPPRSPPSARAGQGIRDRDRRIVARRRGPPPRPARRTAR